VNNLWSNDSMSVDKSSLEWAFFKPLTPWLGETHFVRNVNKNMIESENDAYPGFAEKLRMLSLALLNEKSNFKDLRKALSVLSVVGKVEDIPLIQSLHELNKNDLSVDVNTCLFEIRHINR